MINKLILSVFIVLFFESCSIKKILLEEQYCAPLLNRTWRLKGFLKTYSKDTLERCPPGINYDLEFVSTRKLIGHTNKFFYSGKYKIIEPNYMELDVFVKPNWPLDTANYQDEMHWRRYYSIGLNKKRNKKKNTFYIVEGNKLKITYAGSDNYFLLYEEVK